MTKKILFSAMQPTGMMTLGNYISVLQHIKNVQKDHFCLFCIADLHAITVRHDSKLLKKSILDTAAFYLASGVNSKTNILFVQSEVHEHTYLYWILNCYSYFGELTRMIQFKEKSFQNHKNINSGLLNYPILMAADVLLYQTNTVLVGVDQKQHLELIHKIAKRLNIVLGKKFFTVPVSSNFNPKIKVMSLLNPNKKMSKTDLNQNNTIFLLENQKSIFKKIKHAITDSDIPGSIYYDLEKKIGISNLLNIFSLLTGDKIKDLEKKYFNITYANFKKQLSEVIFEHLFVLQKKYFDIRNDEDYLRKIMKQGAKKAKIKAEKTIKLLDNYLGLTSSSYTS